MDTTNIAYAHDKGPREHLEDDYGAFSVALAGKKPLRITALVLADGVGGAQHGEVASAITVKQVKSSLAASIAALDQKVDIEGVEDQTIFQLLEEALAKANDAVLNEIERDSKYKGMSATVVCAVIINSKVYVAWAGDSRCYVYRNGKIKQITRDHSQVQPLVDAGLIEQECAKTHALSHTISRFVGMPHSFSADKTSYHLSPGDIIFVCSDGLTDGLKDRQITYIIHKQRQGAFSFERLPKKLAHYALKAKSMDNVTVVCCEYLPDPATGPEFFDFTLTGAYPVELAKTLRKIRQERRHV